MNFIAPEFLYALGFLAIPILIHLFNFRRYKTVQFSQVRFLKSIKKQTQSTSRLKNLIVLACRCLALAALVFAFAQPYLIDNKSVEVSGKKGVVVYIDNSFSMQASAKVGSLLDDSKNKAITIANAYKESDKFQLHTNQFNANEQRWLNREAFIDQLQKVDFSANFRTIDAITNRLNSAENDNDLSLDYYLIGDLQKSSYQPNNIQDSANFYVVPVQSQEQQNSYIKAFTSFQPFHLPSMNESFNLRVQQNEDGERNQINGKLFLNDKLKNPFIIEMERDSAEKEINFINPETNQVLGKVAIKDYPVIFDDTFYFSYPADRAIEVYHLFEDIDNKSMSSLFSEDSLIDFKSTTVKNINYSKLKTANLVVLENCRSLSTGLIFELTSFIKNGGTVLFLPALNMDVVAVNSLFNQFGIAGYGKEIKDTIWVNQLNSKASLFDNVFEEKPTNINYPVSYNSWIIQQNQNSISEQLLAFSNGTSFLKKYEINSGALYLCASNLSTNASNFGKHALFVPTIYNMALESARRIQTSYQMNDSKIVLNAIQASESPIKFKKGDYEWIPKQKWKENSVDIFLGNSISEPGFYSVIQDNKVIEQLAFNYNRDESDLKKFKVEEFKEQAAQKGLTIEFLNGDAETLSASINALGKAAGIWKYFIILSLIFIALEILFLRIIK
ncbi:BatA domain-containing protein [Vicingaceae bacterium]|nr:BatA domain-containing protein [Vicingaceae bacterium]